MRVRLALLLLCPSLAIAANYEVPLNDVDEEDDIIALEQKGDISTETADILLDLIRDGVDLNSASRDQLYDLPGLNYTDVDAIILYRKNKGRIEDPTELVGGGALTGDQLLLITPFIRLEPAAFRLPVGGRFQLLTATSNGDFQTQGGPTAPPILLGGKLRGPWGFTAGFLFDTTRRQVSSPRYDSLRQQLVVDPLGYRFGIPALWAQWKSGQAKIVIGTFTIGFAERLTLDNTRRFTPEGIYENDYYRRPIYATHAGYTDQDPYITPDFSLRPNFRGAAGSIEDLEFGTGQKLSLYGFISYASRNIYQYEVYDKNGGATGLPCDDPRDDTNPSCSSPPIAIVRGNDLSQDVGLKFSTLPSLYEELLGGGHVEFKPNDRFRFGITGYGATNFFHGSPLKLDTQEWSHIPYGGPFGAIGVDARAQFGKFGLFIEATRSFDSIKAAPTFLGLTNANAGGGGFGIEQRTVYSPKGHELELSFRYYDLKFGNPYARPFSAPDELDGQRARDEAGVRLKYAGKLPADFELHARADFWTLPYSIPGGEKAGTSNLYSVLRLDYEGFRVFKPAVWIDIRNRDLRDNQHGKCAGTVVIVEGSSTADCIAEPNIEGVTAPSVGTGDSYRLATRLDFYPLGRKLSASTQFSLTWADDVKYLDRFRQDVIFWGEIRSAPVDFLQFRLRSKFLWQDTSTTNYLEQSLWTFLEGTYILNRNFRFTLRYDVYAYLDKRDSTLKRFPNPEHRFFLDVSAGF
jgi:hypothetical protein